MALKPARQTLENQLVSRKFEVPNPTDHFEAKIPGCLLLVSRSQTTTQSDSIDSHGTGLGSPRMTARDQNFERYLIRKPVVRYNV